ncbi:ATP-grasp domain-containing protein [Gracilibacillus kekensis]|uniref:Ribosomal protein S6--L-glutamate ligase/gamma-F420-2:alpha-L-glutamate ligase n=1 Tax=Gracilibacillus kekensis TaxID=1027249 RepID=A0A1M7QAP8_9BACI|nr:RimK family alpha-L-glutamate ligase [Gracilibacillus kekensis]SHN27807.1 ribosomal protein S6--L-glutamate ligase/gamma-F420-2:alpha-L-glutamate ligase [Gracilibacillus kekensis]
MEAWIIYEQEDAEKNKAYIDWCITEADSLQVELKLVYVHQVCFGIKNHQLFIEWNHSNSLPDFVIMRTINDLLSRQFEFMGVPVYNAASVASVANDKAKTHQLLAQHNIPMVDTLFLNRSSLIEHEFHEFPFVIKEVAGRGGKQVHKIESNQEVKDIIPQLNGEQFIVQSLAKSGKDVRVFVIGKQIIAAILRESNQDFRANHSLGGTARPYLLNQLEKNTVDKIVELFPFGMVGIDFIFDEDNRPLFNEIEDVVGSRTLSKHTDINIVRLYLEFIVSNLK